MLAKCLCGFAGWTAAGPVPLSSSCSVPGRVLTLNIDELVSFPLCSDSVKHKMCALVGFPLRFSASSFRSSSSFCLFILARNETAPVVCYETQKANNPSLNNRAQLKRKKKKNLAPGCRSASGPGIRLQLAQPPLSRLGSVLKEENVIPRCSSNYDFIHIIIVSPLFFHDKKVERSSEWCEVVILRGGGVDGGGGDLTEVSVSADLD